MQSTERWLPVVGYEGLYEVSDLGRVRSVDHYARAGQHDSRIYRGRVLSTTPGGNPPRCAISMHNGRGRQATRLVHHVVLEAFVGPMPDGMEACHNDGDATNNRLDNLRWDTHVNNEADKARHGTHNNTVKTHCPQGHLLQEPNLVISELIKGGRKCMACNRARAWAHKRGIEFDQRIADDRYRRIMHALTEV